MPDQLDKLFVDSEELNKELLASVLENKVKITEDLDILFLGNFPPQTKILLYGLAKKVMFIKKKVEEEGFGPKEVSLKTGVPEGTSKVYVRQLERSALLLKKDGKYTIPNFALNKIKELLDQNGKNK